MIVVLTDIEFVNNSVKIVSSIEKCGYVEVPKLVYFSSKTLSRVLGNSTIDPEICQETGVGGRKSLKTIC